MGGFWLFLLGPSFHHLFVVATPPETLSSRGVSREISRPPRRILVSSERIVLEDTTPSGTLQVRLTGLAGGMASLEDLQEARLRYATAHGALSGGLFPLRVGREFRVMGLNLETRRFALWGGETRARKRTFTVALTPGVRGPYRLPLAGPAEGVVVWWRGRRLPADEYRIEGDGSLWLEGFPDILPGDRLVVEIPVEVHRMVGGGAVHVGGIRVVGLGILPVRVTAAAYDTVDGVFVFVGEGRGRVQPVFVHVGEGYGNYRFDPALGGFRYVGEGAGTHRAYLDLAQREVLLGSSGGTGNLQYEVWGSRQGEIFRSTGWVRLDGETFGVWGGMQDTSLGFLAFPGDWPSWLGAEVHLPGWRVLAEGDPGERMGRVDVDVQGARGWLQASGLRDPDLFVSARGGLRFSGGLASVGRLTLSPSDTLWFTGLRMADRGFSLEAGIRVQNGIPREEMRLGFSRPCLNIQTLWVGEEPWQGELRWCRGPLQGVHRREVSFFPGPYALSATPRILERHRLRLGPLRVEWLWDEASRFRGQVDVMLPQGGLSWVESRGDEAYRMLQGFWSGRLGRLSGAYTRTGGGFAAEVVALSGQVRLERWRVLWAYDRRRGTITAEHRAGGLGYACSGRFWQSTAEVWYHHTREPAWFLIFPRGLEVRWSFSGRFQVDGGQFLLSGGVTARQDGWVAPTLTFTYRSTSP